MKNLTLKKISSSINVDSYEINLSMDIKELYDLFPFDNNTTGNALIDHLFYNELSEKLYDIYGSNNWCDSWQLANKNEDVNLKFILEINKIQNADITL